MAKNPFLTTKRRRSSAKKRKISLNNTLSADSSILHETDDNGLSSPPKKLGRPPKVPQLDDMQENDAPAEGGARNAAQASLNEPLNELMAVVKEEPRSRDPSIEPAIVASRLDGTMKGHPLGWAERAIIEKASAVIYPYPRFSSYSERMKRINKNRVLDLMLDDEIDVGEDDSNATTDYHVSGVISVDSHSALIVWTGFKFPTWSERGVLNSTTALSEYNRRVRILDPIFKRLIAAESYDSIRKNYPNVSIVSTDDYNQYIKHPGILYLCGLLKRERQINAFQDEYYGRSTEHAPRIIFADATNFEKSSIPSFEYLIDAKMSRLAAEISNLLVAKKTSCKCTAHCSLASSCCAMLATSKMAYGKKNVLCNVDKVKEDAGQGHFENSPEFVDSYECGDACTCDKNKCIQRAVQLGSQQTLVAFMHHEKGWTLWAGADMEAGTFVCVYTGLMMEAKEASSKNKTYQMELELKTSSGKKKMIIDANKMGSEARFVAHSCDPNLFSYRVHFDIDGRPKRHIALYTKRNIKAGEELTLDYHIGVHDPEHFHRIAKFICRCGAKCCREKAYQALIKKPSYTPKPITLD